ncbi:MAG: glycosyltransferase family 39 protein [Anaerolineae bacterium]|nr:glycosyltransferase family 39 protein [Anaerolineae bacterium]
MLAVAIVLAAYGLQLHRLDAQSFAFDEGWTSYAIHHPWLQMWRVLVPDNHPPLYYLIAKGFAELAGYGDLAVRYVSVAGATCLVALCYALGHRLFGAVAGLASAAFAASAPLVVYYAQEARMYSLLMALVALSAYALIRVAGDARRRAWWVVYVASTCAALYTHYFAVLVVVLHAGAALAWAIARRQWRFVRWWVAAQAATAALYLPWLPVAVQQVRIGQGTWWRIPLPGSTILADMWRFLNLGPRRPVDVPLLGSMLGGVALALIVALILGWRRGWAGWAFAISSLLVPALAIATAGHVWPIYTDRYAVVAAPGLALTVGLGVAACWHALPGRRSWLGQGAAALLLLAVLVGPLGQVRAYYQDPSYWRQDFRRAARYIEDTASRGDAVILVGSYQPIMQYYGGEAAVVRFPAQGDSVQDEGEVVRMLNEVVTPDSQVRLVMYSWDTVDPQGLVEGALRAQCRLQGEHWQRETGQRPIKVLNFEGCARFEVLPRVALDAVFGEQVALSGYSLIRFVPGQQAHAFLWWRTLSRPERNYSAFVHLIDAQGRIVAQFDHLPLNNLYPMLAWPIGTDQRDDAPLNLPAGVSLEGAWLAVGLYNLRSMQRLDARVDGHPVGDYVRIPVE